MSQLLQLWDKGYFMKRCSKSLGRGCTPLLLRRKASQSKYRILRFTGPRWKCWFGAAAGIVGIRANEYCTKNEFALRWTICVQKFQFNQIDSQKDHWEATSWHGSRYHEVRYAVQHFSGNDIVKTTCNHGHLLEQAVKHGSPSTRPFETVLSRWHLRQLKRSLTPRAGQLFE